MNVTHLEADDTVRTRMSCLTQNVCLTQDVLVLGQTKAYGE